MLPVAMSAVKAPPQVLAAVDLTFISSCRGPGHVGICSFARTGIRGLGAVGLAFGRESPSQ